MATGLRGALLAVPVLLALGSVPAAAGLPPRAGVAGAVAGRWSRALDRLEALPEAERGRAENYFLAAARLELGLREPALAELRALSDSGGPYAGPALELAVATLFAEGRFDRVAEWAAASRGERYQDADTLQYRVGQSLLLLGRTEAARGHLERVTAGPRLPYALHSLALLDAAAGRFGPAVDLLGAGISAAEQLADPRVGEALADTLRIARGRVLYQLAANGSGLDEASRVDLAELAREQFEQVGEDRRAYPDALRGVGWCTLEVGDSSRALASFAAAGGMDPAGRAEDLWAQGRVYERLGYYDEAARSYREAGVAAGELAAALDRGEFGGRTPAPEASRWERRGAALADRAGDREDLGGRLAALAAAAAARGRRLDTAHRTIGARRQRVVELQGELVDLSTRLQAFLDRIPAEALFPPEERGRVGGLAALQQSLNRDVVRIESALGAIADTVFWRDASAGQRARGEALWARLGAARATLGDVQLAFLVALKARVSKRETELAGQIEQLQQGVRELAEPLAAAQAAHRVAVERGAALRRRVDELGGRVAALDRPLGVLRADAEAGVARAEIRERERRAEQLRLHADAYALDEVQALHLMQEGPR